MEASSGLAQTAGAGNGFQNGQPLQNNSQSWMDRVSKQERIAVVEQMVAMFRRINPQTTGEKMYDLCRRLEHMFWKKCESDAQYRDPAALKEHIRTCSDANLRARNAASGAPMSQQQHQQQVSLPMSSAQMVMATQQQQQQPLMSQRLVVSGGMLAPNPGIVPMNQDHAAPPNGYNGIFPMAAPRIDPHGILAGQAPMGAGGHIAVGGVGNGLAVAGDPAGTSTAESETRNTATDPMGGMYMQQQQQQHQQAFMSNGAPVLVRGGGACGGGGTVGGGSVPGIIPISGGGMLAYPLVPQAGGGGVKLETGGMVPVSMPLGVVPQNAGAGDPPPSSGATVHTPPTLPPTSSHQALSSMAVPGSNGTSLRQASTGTANMSVSMANTSQGGGVPPLLQTLPDGMIRDGSVGGGGGVGLDDLGGSCDFPFIGSLATDHEVRKQQILKQQRWLLFLRHCAKCNLSEAQCQYSQNCTVAKNLWQHLIQCKDPACTYARCVPSRDLLKHHQNCRSDRCPVCTPVKQYVSKQRQAVLAQRLQGMAPEDRERFKEHLRKRNILAKQAAAASGSGGGGGGARAVVDATDGASALVVGDPQALSKRPRLITQENMGTSLIEYFSVEQIQQHLQRLRLSGTPGGSEKQQQRLALLEYLAEEESQCKVCHNTKLTFEPPSLYCYGCNAKIKRNQTYHTPLPHPDYSGNWCHACFTASGPTIHLETFVLRKADFVKKKNDKVEEEGWVQCDSCEGWVHQICGLFNKGRNNDDRGFICPECLLQGLVNRTRKIPRERPQAMLTAKDLPRCELSDFIEARLAKTVADERVARAASLGKPVHEVPSIEGLCVRVVNNVEKLNEVKMRFADAFCPAGYPRVFEYKQKVVLLFQELEGVDMCLYCLYLQEYGENDPLPNKRTVYLSYLDSVKYFQPEAVEAGGMGIALRTFVYHEILMGYIAYAKAHGFCSMYIWACPPTQGDDYIMYCHPGRQKNPRSDRLREWYLAMLRRSRAEGTVVYISNLFDSFFVGGRDHRLEHPSVTALPYFEGDYWPGEAENLLANMNQSHGGGGLGSGSDSKPRINKGSKAKAWRAAPGGNTGEQLLSRLGDVIQGMKEDFIVAHMYESCSHCTDYIDGGMRHYHPDPPQKVVIKSERTFDGIALDRPGGESSRTIQLNRFQLCQKCYDREAGRDGAHPIGLPSGIELSSLVAEQCPAIPSTTPDPVPRIDNEFFDTRHLFLGLCQGNHYQFDTLRRARHSSMMVLYHLHNPSEPAFTATCNYCQAEVKPGEGYRCLECSDFDLCHTCYASPSVTHPHRLIKSTAKRRFDETRERLTEEDRVNRGKALQRTMQLLVHASGCGNSSCPSSNCAKVKALFNHAVNCSVKVTGGCMLCRRMWALLQAHAKICTSVDCPVPRCRELRQLRRQQASRQEDKRRAAYRQMLQQQEQQQQQEQENLVASQQPVRRVGVC